jgi:hypothetical protein
MVTFKGLIKVILVPFLVVFLVLPALSFSDQTTSERILSENRHFISFLNVSLSNFAPEKKDEFLKAYQIHFNADVAYLQGDYKRTYRRIYESQGEMVKLYEDVVKDIYLEDSKSILDKMAPAIIRSKNAKARLFLTLGYRDRTVSRNYYIVGEASRPKLHSYKLYQYEEAIKMARRSKRYGFLALFESQNRETKMAIYNQMLKTENEKGNTLFFQRFVDKKEDAYIKEMQVTYEEYEKKIEENQGEDAKFEKRLERRVRFRREKQCAEYLINAEFERADDVIRSYVDDFNYKLITATFDVLQERSGEGGVDYASMKIHLQDNYLRISKESLLDEISGDVKVVDSVEEKDKDDTEDDERKSPEETDKETNEDDREEQN